MKGKKAKFLRKLANTIAISDHMNVVELDHTARIQTVTNPFTKQVHRFRTVTMAYPKGCPRQTYQALKAGKLATI